jgi:hypothetical protein
MLRNRSSFTGRERGERGEVRVVQKQYDVNNPPSFDA